MLFFFFAKFTHPLLKGVEYFMKTYNVTEIAILLSIDKETVRRWIRSGELNATCVSKKKGNVINECDLLKFVETKPKYRKLLNSQDDPVDNTYNEKLKEVLNDLIKERDMLNERINKIQALLEG
jgi:excisionase family DNA binding protein